MSTENTQKELIEQICAFNRIMDWDKFHSPENLAKSISIEAGELLECFQWSDDYNQENVCEELADVYSYLLMLANALGVDLNEIALQKLEKTKSKYPVEKFRGISTKYNRLEK